VACSGESAYDELEIQGVPISIDSGLHGLVLESLASKGAIVTGTIIKSRGQFPFSVFSTKKEAFLAEIKAKSVSASAGTNSEKMPIHFISEVGCKSCYWIKRKLSSGVDVFQVAMRQENGKIVYLSTTDKSLGPTQWIFEPSHLSKHPYRASFKYEDDCDAEEEDRNFIEDFILHKGILELCNTQNNAIWFLM
jgi:hypothetical protein